MNVVALMVGALLAIVPVNDPTKRVHDLAGVLFGEQRDSLEGLAQDLERRTSAELAIVTVPSLEGLTVDDYANQLFNKWGIGKRGRNNGVLLLVAPNERRMRIEVGYGLEPLLTDALCGEIRDQFIVPRFKENDYPGGITAGANEINRILLANPQAAQGVEGSSPELVASRRQIAQVAIGVLAVVGAVLAVIGVVASRRRLYSTTLFALTTVVGAIVLAVAGYLLWRTPAKGQPWAAFGGAGLGSFAAWFYNVFRYRRFGPHGCSKCGTRLELLSEQDEDPKLTSVQQLEEKIGSVDYDVWICPACLNSDTERYIQPFSSFRECPACHARTFKEEPRVVISPATTFGSGVARIDGRCVACNHKTVRTVVLPRIVQSSSSSSGSSWGGMSSGGGGGGSSFGGGSSGGGGASGGW